MKRQRRKSRTAALVMSNVKPIQVHFISRAFLNACLIELILLFFINNSIEFKLKRIKVVHSEKSERFKHWHIFLIQLKSFCYLLQT